MVRELARPPADEGGELTWVDREGRATRITDRSGLGGPALSPEGRRIAGEVGGDLCVYDLGRDTFTKVTSGGMRAGQVGEAAWSPDGTRIMFSRQDVIYAVAADGSAPPVRLSALTERHNGGSWLPDGVTRAYVDAPTVSQTDIWIQPPSGPPFAIVATPAAETTPVFSPDGRWLAYVAGDVIEYAGGEGRAVYVQAYPSGARLRVSPGDGTKPRWARSERELFYMTPRGEVVSVPVDSKSSRVFGQPRVLFSGAFSPTFDVDREGRRFLMTTRREGRRLLVTLNWFEELRRKLPPVR